MSVVVFVSTVCLCVILHDKEFMFSLDYCMYITMFCITNYVLHLIIIFMIDIIAFVIVSILCYCYAHCTTLASKWLYIHYKTTCFPLP